MNKKTASRIDDMLYESGLFPSSNNINHTYNSYDFSNETILITGAAGSIGSGLTKQLINCKYKKLIVVDIAESPLYELIKELEFKDTIHIEFKLLDITNKNSIKYLFKTYKPTIIFHAAAYKHVPMMESNPHEAVKLNILGTKLLADLAREYEVKKFIFISTDKAVNPIGVMGKSKRIGELYMNYLNNNSSTKYITTRFGNIFGSNGSVIPLLKKQIEFESPLTITDESMTRLFISKQKACNLILKLASKNDLSYNLYTLNMGTPIKVIDIIKRLIALYKDVSKQPEIKVIGLRPGEKMHEEIAYQNENLIKTNDSDILAIEQQKLSSLNIDFRELQNVTAAMSNTEINNILKKYI
ncbi:hypothetical protein DIS18_08970 [Algibacter marinivivus]|uniref:Polysaccharide biosynthesis protein CapD-like domain-containing protein n=1 Tax=Algibacter marinivivus TaxID=2100723 RepID=A0A2U2X3P4_9FLAO|nr:polysaccharide biosynthesis protein [Algibacter marinivivus]PWH82374.1 hypothetical protein DIS18_08970 [Algibacter marinivivus]